MTPVKFLAALRYRRWTLLVCVVAALAVFGVIAALTQRSYSSTEQVLVTAGSSAGSTPSQNDVFAQQRAVAYAEIARGTTVAERAADSIGLPLSPSAVASRVTATVVPTTSLIDITVTDSNPTRARQLASAVGSELITMVSGIESVPGQQERALEISVASEAQLGTSTPVSVLAQWAVLALIAGLFLGAAVVWLRERVRPTVGGMYDTQATLEPRFGVVDNPGTIVGSEFVDTSKLTETERDALRTTRTMLVRSVGSVNNAVVGLCSSDGRQPTLAAALLLGATFADSYRMTVVVECDVRNPSLAKAMSLPDTPGLSELLHEHSNLDDSAMPTPHRMLDVIGIGSPFTDGGELLGSNAMVQLIDDLRASYDVVILSLPAVSARPDAVIIGPLCDCVAVLTTQRRTSTTAVALAVAALSKASTVVGTVTIR